MALGFDAARFKLVRHLFRSCAHSQTSSMSKIAVWSLTNMLGHDMYMGAR